MSYFTDVSAAIDEADWLAADHQVPYVIVAQGEGLEVISYSECKFQGREWLEVFNPPARWEAA